MAKTEVAEKLEKELYPQVFGQKFVTRPLVGHALGEVRIQPCHSAISPLAVSLKTAIGPVKLNYPLLSAAMDAVSGAKMLKALSEVGACGVAYWDKDPERQLEIVEQALAAKPFLVSRPKSVRPDDIIEKAEDILKEHSFSTIPVLTKGGVLTGLLFTRDVAFRNHLNDPVSGWMMPYEKLKKENSRTPLARIRERLLTEKDCNVLPIVNRRRKLVGLYFMKDFFVGEPSGHQGKPLVGLAVGVHPSDLERVKKGLELGVGVFCLDSSHGNNDQVIAQAKKIVGLAAGQAAVIAGNIADIDGYLRLAEAGVDGVKCGIGPGSICTTSQVTGAAYPMFTLLRELRYAKLYLRSQKKPAPAIIADGSLEGPGDLAIAIAAGADAGMAGKWLVAAEESESCQTYGVQNGTVKYWGMASEQAIKKRRSVRYGQGKTAPEGVSGKVPFRGPLKSWFGKDMELVCGGFSHAGARDIAGLHRFGDDPKAFVVFSGAGIAQNTTRIEI